MNYPTISVIIPAFNRADFLPSALQTVRDQNITDLEVVLVDDGSDDGLESAARQHALRYIRQVHAGQSAARNRGVREAAGEFITFLDIDDLWMPGQLTHLLDALRSHAGAGIAQGLMRQVMEASDGSQYQSAPYRMPYLGSCLFRRWVFDNCGLFDETMAVGEDYDFLFRCWENDVEKVHVDNVSLLYRRHPGNISAGTNDRAHLLVLKRRMERVRAGVIDPDALRRVPFQSYIGDLSAVTSGSGQVMLWGR